MYLQNCIQHVNLSVDLPGEHSQCPAINSNVLCGSQEVQCKKYNSQKYDTNIFLWIIISHHICHIQREHQHEHSNQILHWHQPWFSSSKCWEIYRVHNRCPEEFDTKRPVHKAKYGLLFVADISTREEIWDAASQTERNALENIEEHQQRNVVLVTTQTRATQCISFLHLWLILSVVVYMDMHGDMWKTEFWIYCCFFRCFVPWLMSTPRTCCTSRTHAQSVEKDLTLKMKKNIYAESNVSKKHTKLW